MKKLIGISVLFVLIGILFEDRAFAQMNSMMGMMRHSMIRHRYFMMNGLPLQYRNLRNPLEPSAENIRNGGRLFATHCSSCHGKEGYGDGPAGRTLTPLPSNIASVIRMPIASDSYLFWTIADGGKNLHTAMPAFIDIILPQDIWKIILYLRAGLPTLQEEK